MEVALVDNKDALKFMLAGKCEVTIKSIKTGVRFSYKIIKQKSNTSTTYNSNKEEFVYFVRLIRGADEVFAGTMRYNEEMDMFTYNQGRKGEVIGTSVEIQGLLYVVNHLHKGIYDIKVEIYHCGSCGRCGRRLTTPESILTGLGPECAKLCGVPHPLNKRSNKHIFE